MAIANIAIVNTPEMLQECFSIRKRVFVEEQNVPFELEMDHYDDEAVHYLLKVSNISAGTARLIDKNGIAKIGRVAIVSEQRGKGYGLLLMQYIVEDARGKGFAESMLDAQTYAVPFYERLGFKVVGDEFDDAGIPHLHMRARLA